MHEEWLQKYIKDHYRQIGFSALHGPYKVGADFKGIYAGQAVKIEAEWDYADYISHEHSLEFADVLVVASREPAPARLIDKLPSIIIHLDRYEVSNWAQPRLLKKNKEDYFAYPWRRLSKSLLDLYIYYQKQKRPGTDYPGSSLIQPGNQAHTPPGFQFAAGGREEGYSGPADQKAAWDDWLDIAHQAARHFHLKPALLRPTWIDRIDIYYNQTGRMTEGEWARFQEVGGFIDELLTRAKAEG
jgi:hypothetical protein